jgi:hypothetical protein
MVRFALNHWLLMECPVVQAVHAVFMRGDDLSRKLNIFCLRVNTTRQVGLLGQILLVNDLASFLHGLKLSRRMDGLWNY